MVAQDVHEQPGKTPHHEDHQGGEDDNQEEGGEFPQVDVEKFPFEPGEAFLDEVVHQNVQGRIVADEGVVALGQDVLDVSVVGLPDHIKAFGREFPGLEPVFGGHHMHGDRGRTLVPP